MCWEPVYKGQGIQLWTAPRGQHESLGTSDFHGRIQKVEKAWIQGKIMVLCWRTSAFENENLGVFQFSIMMENSRMWLPKPRSCQQESQAGVLLSVSSEAVNEPLLPDPMDASRQAVAKSSQGEVLCFWGILTPALETEILSFLPTTKYHNTSNLCRLLSSSLRSLTTTAE